jgi:hypothetical protein
MMEEPAVRSDGLGSLPVQCDENPISQVSEPTRWILRWPGIPTLRNPLFRTLSPHLCLSTSNSLTGGRALRVSPNFLTVRRLPTLHLQTSEFHMKRMSSMPPDQMSFMESVLLDPRAQRALTLFFRLGPFSLKNDLFPNHAPT